MHRKSYWKTIKMLFIVTILCFFVYLILDFNNFSGLFFTTIKTLMIVLILAFSLVMSGGFICLLRDNRIELGLIDTIGASLKGGPPKTILSTSGMRFLFGDTLRPGDTVEIRTLDEIKKTFDDDFSLDGLPFMPEMQEYCGMRFQVHRRVDKIYDMRNKTGMRRLQDAVTLTSVRCNGAQHDNCQAECHILWKDAWLKKTSSCQTANRPIKKPLIPATTYDGEKESYVCQMTRLWEATEPMSPFDIRQDLRPLVSGNVSLGVYVIVLLTRLFNTVQKLRGGICFPYMPPSSQTKPMSDNSELCLVPGQSVMVKSRSEISETLKNSKTKGLWYDQDMIRYCGNSGTLYKKVDHIIHEGTGKMVDIKTPCWIIKDIMATGEFQRLNPQQEFTYWREAWLHPHVSKE
ncbi:MAG: hypothetical protein JW725_00200 [Candidatus Babeliaceae bacterium]|nr:hypothetical protein [Candidatus Babeliaceae bacterium]